MEKLIRTVLLGLTGILFILLIVGLVLAWVPSQSSLTHQGISSEEADELRRKLEQPHNQFQTSDGETLFLRRWNPDSSNIQKNNIAVLIFHGITAHSGAYSKAGKALADAGYTTFGLDYRGHGLSGGNRGDSPGKDRWISDLTETVHYVKGLGYSKVVILGHSLGVAATIYTTMEIPNEISGLILMSGGYRARPGVRKSPSFLQKMRILASSIFRPSHQVVEYYREGMTGLDDPLFNFKYTLRFLRMLNIEELALPEHLEIPVLVGVGDKDELFEIDAVREFYEDVPVQRKKFIVIEGAHHARFPDDSWDQLTAWLKKYF